jgi:hypothetical protein
MTIKLKCEITEGPVPAERVVRIQGADGSVVELTVSDRNLAGNLLEASEIGRKANQVLVELPRETASGYWRIWVNESSVGA